MNNLKGKRRIKINHLEKKPDEKFLDPQLLIIKQNISNDNIYITKFAFDDELNLVNVSADRPNNNLNEKKMMLTPSLIINSNEILKLYKVDDISEFINSHIKNKSYNFLNRILNCWIRNNIDDLKKNYNILIDIYIEIINQFYKEIANKNKIIKYLKYWLKKNNKNSFFINLGDDLIKFLSI